MSDAVSWARSLDEELQASRSQMVHLFDELVKTIPDGVRLNSMKQAGDTLTLTGVAQSTASVADYMKRLDASQWLKRTDLQQTEAKGGGDRREPFAFGLTVKLTSPEEKEKERLAAEGKTAPDAPAAPGAKPATSPAATTPASTPPAATGTPGSKP